MTTFQEHKKELLKNSKFKEAFENLRPEYEIIQALIDARTQQKITQKELAQKTGLKQSHISRLENGNHNPSLNFLKKIAKGLNKELHIVFK
jgi:predicted transcriptional regulator